MGFDLATIAPRLALAYRQRQDEIVADRIARHHARERLLRAERLVAHRDLQLLRAGHTGNRRYIKRRHDKLERARRELEAAQRHAEAIGACTVTRTAR